MNDIVQELRGDYDERMGFGLLPRAAEEIERLRGALEAARAYAKHERDLGAEEVAIADAGLIQTLQDDLAEAVEALKPFTIGLTKANKIARVIVERHKESEK